MPPKRMSRHLVSSLGISSTLSTSTIEVPVAPPPSRIDAASATRTLPPSPSAIDPPSISADDTSSPQTQTNGIEARRSYNDLDLKWKYSVKSNDKKMRSYKESLRLSARRCKENTR
ncbi:hypothetical protein U1Q18_012039 [Sarracenia purpurea var. burkii]